MAKLYCYANANEIPKKKHAVEIHSYFGTLVQVLIFI